MSLARNIREQLLKSFRAELAEHIQTMTDGLLALEQGRADQNTLDTAFRAAHSLKGASRALGVSAIEQIAHSLESLLDGCGGVTCPLRRLSSPPAIMPWIPFSWCRPLTKPAKRLLPPRR
jgi:chemotaxis protein histidine kinase CheA